MATHSSILAWRIPRTEESGGLQSMGSQRTENNRLSMHAMGTPERKAKENRGERLWLKESIMKKKKIAELIKRNSPQIQQSSLNFN